MEPSTSPSRARLEARRCTPLGVGTLERSVSDPAPRTPANLDRANRDYPVSPTGLAVLYGEGRQGGYRVRIQFGYGGWGRNRG